MYQSTVSLPCSTFKSSPLSFPHISPGHFYFYQLLSGYSNIEFLQSSSLLLLHITSSTSKVLLLMRITLRDHSLTTTVKLLLLFVPGSSTSFIILSVSFSSLHHLVKWGWPSNTNETLYEARHVVLF
mmetsp:Transcript_20707/g.41243  ORF Transcript_20707/g.41243 Transcript_20707/m.41243 type:complete len:127 (+) Transcript_20707:573-953(+)